MKKLFVAFITILFLIGNAMAEEKPINIKGLSLGMPISEAREVLSKALAGNWKVTQTGETQKILSDYSMGNEQIFGTKFKPSSVINVYSSSYTVPVPAIVGDYGFAINKDSFYEGFVSGDAKTQKVTRISFSGEITEALYNPDRKQKLNMDDFVEQFTMHFNLPDFKWIPHGWIYQSPNGYVITFKTDRMIDIKADDIRIGDSDNEKVKIKF